MRKSGKWALIAVVVGGGFAVTTGDAVAEEGAASMSAVRCHVDVDVRLKGARFESTGYPVASCAGRLHGQQITGAAFSGARGRISRVHHAPWLPPVFGASEVRLRVRGPSLPLHHQVSAPVKFALVPGSLARPGGGMYTGVARVHGRDHDAAAVVTFRPDAAKSARAGRLSLDLNLGY